jgi:hypothetical protein
MKTIAWCVLALLLLPGIGLAQAGFSHDRDLVLKRVERAFQQGSPRQIEDLLRSGMNLRVGEAVSYSVADITAMKALTEYFAGKDSIEFRLAETGSGMMAFWSEGKRDSTRVDVWLTRDRDGLAFSALSISNHPLATAFPGSPAYRR